MKAFLVVLKHYVSKWNGASYLFKLSFSVQPCLLGLWWQMVSWYLVVLWSVSTASFTARSCRLIDERALWTRPTFLQFQQHNTSDEHWWLDNRFSYWYIVPYHQKNIDFFNILQYSFIFSWYSSLHCRTGEKDCKCGKLVVSKFNDTVQISWS